MVIMTTTIIHPTGFSTEAELPLAKYSYAQKLNSFNARNQQLDKINTLNYTVRLKFQLQSCPLYYWK